MVDLLFGGDFEAFLDEDGQVDEGEVGRSLWLEGFEEDLRTEEAEGFVYDIVGIGCQFWRRSVQLGLQRAQSNSAC